jgi:ABC-2 type transport system ATP-binding protein
MQEGQVTLAVPEGAQVVPRLFTELGVGIRSVTVTRPSLDDVFLTYTGRTIRDSEGPGRAMAPFAGRR